MAASQAPKFDILIVGAGIAGLATGIGLGQQGHHVTILEGAHELAPIGIGLHIPPNATLVLKQFSMLEKMEKDAMYPSTFNFRRWADSSRIATFPASRPTQSGGLPYWTMKRSDYQSHLYNAAIDAGCKIRLSARVDKLDVDAPSVVLTSGEHLTADMIVVADGVKSHLRSQVIPEVNTSMTVNEMSAYRAYANKEDLLADPVTAPLFQEPATNVWLGYNHHFIIYPSGDGLYTVGATHPADNHEAMSWSATATTEEALEDFADFDPTVRRILSYTKDLKRWRLAEVPRLPRWTSKSGKTVLVGDAAHGMLQYLAQGAAMATEDAAALTQCVGRAQTGIADIPSLLRAFERSRKWRCEIVQANARRSGDVIHMPDGEEQEQRDRAMNGLPSFLFSESQTQTRTQTGLSWNADPGPLMDDKFRAFLYGHNVFDHTNKVLDSAGL